MNKDKFSGKVYLELTFWSNVCYLNYLLTVKLMNVRQQEPAPEKKVTPKPTKSKQYGGPGSFIPSGDLPSSLTNGTAQPSRIVSTGSMYDHSRQNSDNIPASLRASTSLAQLDLYVPPYEQRNHLSPVDKVANEFGEFGISKPHRRRESFSVRANFRNQLLKFLICYIAPPRGAYTSTIFSSGLLDFILPSTPWI